MTQEKNLDKLIKNIQPSLNPGKYVFVSTEKSLDLPSDQIVCVFREIEGFTYVVEKEIADKMDLKYNFIAAWITLCVYSSLEAVGLTAKVAHALALENISCNAIAAYHHDHVFVPFKDGDRAVSILRKL